MQQKTIEDSLLRGILPKKDTTEWDDIQRRLGNFAPEEEDEERKVPQIQPAKSEDEALHERLAKASLDELDELEDDEDEEVLRTYRAKRIAEMQATAIGEVFGYVKEISAPDWGREVTEASKGQYVVVHLFKPTVPHCQLLEQRLQVLARKHKATKFVRCLSHHAIPNYPDKNLPTLIIYKDTNPIMQFIGLAQLGGETLTAEDLEWALSRFKAVKTDMKQPPRTPKVVIHGLGVTKKNSDSESDSGDDDT